MPMPDGNDFRGIPAKDRPYLAHESVEATLIKAIHNRQISAQLLDMAHRHLSKREIEVFLLHGVAGMSYLATAEALGVSVAACRTAWASATKKLRQCAYEV
jgi:DNA-directed RNA polymerase specialized sigma24 family protein